MMSDVARSIASLSSEKRDLLALRLKKKGSQYNTFPLSFAQQRLWFIDQLEPGTPFYNLPQSVRLTGPLDFVALERSLREIARRHEALRTTFQTVNGQPVQVIGPNPVSQLPLLDLTGLPEAARETAAKLLVTEDARYSFDLCAGPVWRAALVRLAPLDHILMLTFHHIVSDAWSMGVFIREVISIYEAFSRNERSPLAGLPIQYADFAHWQRERLKGPSLESLLSYWKQQLGYKVQVLELPTDRPRPAVPRYEGGREEFRLSKKTHDALKALSQQENASLFMTILAAFQ